MSTEDQQSGDSSPTARPNAQITKLMPFLMIMTIMIVIFMFLDSDLSYFPVIIIMTILPFMMILFAKKTQSQNRANPMQPVGPLPWWKAPSQINTQSMNQSSTAPINEAAQGAPDPLLEEKRKMVLNMMNKLQKMFSYIFMPIAIIGAVIIFIMFSGSAFREYDIYLSVFIPVFFVLIIIITVVKRVFPQLIQKLTNDPRFMTGVNNPPVNNQLNHVPKFENQPNSIINKPITSKFDYLNNARADKYTKDEAKIQQQCPFCGYRISGKRDSCPKCKKII